MLSGTNYVINQGLERPRGHEPYAGRLVDELRDDHRQRCHPEPGGLTRLLGWNVGQLRHDRRNELDSQLAGDIHGGESRNVHAFRGHGQPGRHAREHELDARLERGNRIVNLAGGTIQGGKYTSTGGSELVFTKSGGTLDGLTANANLDFSQGSGVNANITDGLTLNAVAMFGASNSTNNAYLTFSGSQTLAGTGSFLFAGTGTRSDVYLSGQNPTLTIGPGITIHGENGGFLFTSNVGTIVNQGTIEGDASGYGMLVKMPTVENQGTLKASGGGYLLVNGLTGSVGIASLSGNGSSLVLGGTNYTINQSLTALMEAPWSLMARGPTPPRSPPPMRRSRLGARSRQHRSGRCANGVNRLSHGNAQQREFGAGAQRGHRLVDS